MYGRRSNISAHDMYTLEYANVFGRDVKNYYRHGGTEKKLGRVLQLLQDGTSLPPALRDHQLKGKLRRFKELHVEPDWLLVYEKDGQELRILCLWLATHQQLKERQKKI